MREFYIVIDQDDDRELVYRPTQYQPFARYYKPKCTRVPKWTFEREDYRVTVYPIALFHMPVGEDREEMEQRILVALNLV